MTGAWTLPELQDLLDEWLLAGWPTRPHDALRDPLAPRRHLLVEPDMTGYESITVRLFRLSGEHYVEHAIAADGQTLISDTPFRIEISTVALLDF